MAPPSLAAVNKWSVILNLPEGINNAELMIQNNSECIRIDENNYYKYCDEATYICK